MEFIIFLTDFQLVKSKNKSHEIKTRQNYGNFLFS